MSHFDNDRAQNSQARFSSRNLNLSGFVFASLATISALVALQTLGSPSIDTKSAVAFKSLATKVLAAPVISEFDKESVMTPEQLLDRWNPIIADASKRFGVPKDWIRAVMRRETGGRTMLAPNQKIVSSAGAMGLMQVMPDTYEELRAEYGLGADPFKPEDNIYAGAAYLRFLKAKYGFPAMFAAYNAGPGRLEQHLHQGETLPDETRAYVGAIGRYLKANIADARFAKLMGPGRKELARIEAASKPTVPAVVVPKEYLDGANAAYNFDNNIQVARDGIVPAVIKPEGTL